MTTLHDASTTESTKTASGRRNAPPASPSELLLVLHQRYPDDTREANQLRFIERALEDEAIIKQALRDWHGLNYNRLIGQTREPEVSPEEKRAQAEARKEKIKATIKSNMVKIVLLEMILPNGKALGDTTGKELRKLAPKITGMCTQILGVVKPDQKVREALTEEQVQGFFAQKQKD